MTGRPLPSVAVDQRLSGLLRPAAAQHAPCRPL